MKIISNHKLYEDFFDELENSDIINDIEDTSLDNELVHMSVDSNISFTFELSNLRNKTFDSSISLVNEFNNTLKNLLDIPLLDFNDKFKYTLFTKYEHPDNTITLDNNQEVEIKTTYRLQSYNMLRVQVDFEMHTKTYRIFDKLFRIIINIFNRSRILIFGKSSKLTNIYVKCGDTEHLITQANLKSIMTRKDMTQTNVTRMYRIYKHIYCGTERMCKVKDVQNFYSDNVFNAGQIKFLKSQGLYNNEDVKVSLKDDGTILAYVPEGNKLKYHGYIIEKDSYWIYNEVKDYIDKLEIVVDGAIDIKIYCLHNISEFHGMRAIKKYCTHINKLSISIPPSVILEKHDSVIGDLSDMDINELTIYTRIETDYKNIYYSNDKEVFKRIVRDGWTLPTFKVSPNTKIILKYPKFKENTITETVLSKYDHNNARTYVSDILFNLVNNEFFYEDAYGAFDNVATEDELRINLIDNGYCITVCTYVSNMLDDSNFESEVQFILLDDHSDSYHCLIEINNRFYDAYNYNGVDKLSDLEFVKMYYSQYPEEQLRNFTSQISTGYFDYNKFCLMKS